MKLLSTVLLLVGATFIASAGDLYVDRENPSASDTNPGTAALPFKSIQAAVAYAATDASGYAFASGDTIWVEPGTYDNGGYVDANALTNRVYITKPVRLVSTGGKSVTSIVGAWDASGSGGCGAAAARCVFVASTANGTIIRGFTIEKGATKTYSSSDNDAQGAGVAAATRSASSFYLVDSTVRFCRSGRYSALRYGTAVRTLFVNNVASYNWGTCGREVNALNCLFWANGDGRYRYTVLEYGTAVNCSFIDNCANGLWDTACYNTLQACANYACDAGRDYNYWEEHHPQTCANHVCTNIASRQVMSTVTGDYRLRPTSPAVNGGVASHLTKIALPAELESERYLDIDGRAIATEGTIHCGAVQAVGTPQGGCVTVSFTFTRDDGTYPAYGYNNYIYAETYPTQHVVRPRTTATAPVFSVRIDARLGGYDGLFPDLQGRFFLTPSPNPATNDVYSLQCTGNYKWTDPVNGSDSNDGTEAAPYKTLEKAMTFARSNNRTVVFCKKGVYNEGSASGARLYMPGNLLCCVRAVEGPEKTFLVGGTGVACAVIPYIGAIQGFTIMGADTSASSAYAGVNASQSKTWLTDCVISNNYSGSKAVLRQVWLQRCLVANNRSKSSWIFESCRLISSIACNNVCESDSSCYIANGTLAYQSTLYNNVGQRFLGGFNCYNCIIAGSGEIRTGCGGVGNTLWGPAYVRDGWTVQDPYLADPANGDCRVAPNSPTIGGGEKPTVDNYGAVDSYGWRILSTSTYDNKPLRFSADGRPDAGAIQYDHPCMVRIAESESGSLAVTGGAKIGLTEVAEGESVTFTISRGSGSVHHPSGFTVNGTYVDLDDYPDGWTTTYTAHGDAMLIDAVLTDRFYAAPDGNDANDGKTRQTPKTLQGAVDFAATYGDTVVALPGQYVTGSRKYAVSDSISARLVIPDGVTVVSDEGAAKTFIVGAASTEATAIDGCGTNAVRCVRMFGTSCLRDVTIMNGHSGLPGDGNNNNCAPAVLGENGKNCYVENCIISNNVNTYRGGCWNAYFVNCQFLANRSATGSQTPTVYYCYAINCYFDHNRGNFTTQYANALVNCTFGRDNLSLDGKTKPTVVWGVDTGFKTYNCLFLAGAGGQNSGVLKNCLFASDGGGDLPNLSTYKHGYTNVTIRPFAELGVDTQGVPLSGESLATDTGDYNLYNVYGTKSTVRSNDLAGIQRVYGGQIDIGCREYDWRVDFAKTLFDAKSSGTVPAAGPWVVLGDGAVTVADGDSLTFRVVQGSASGKMTFYVRGEGTPVFTCPGATVIPGADGLYWFQALSGHTYDVTVGSTNGTVDVSHVSLRNRGLAVFVLSE